MDQGGFAYAGLAGEQADLVLGRMRILLSNRLTTKKN
jgi:hypothetical protein